MLINDWVHSAIFAACVAAYPCTLVHFGTLWYTLARDRLVFYFSFPVIIMYGLLIAIRLDLTLNFSTQFHSSFPISTLLLLYLELSTFSLL